jgi:hypothetical protein
MDYIFDLLFMIVSFSVTTFFNIIAFIIGWFMGFVVFASIIFAIFTPLEVALNKVPAKYEKLTKLRDLISGGSWKLLNACVIGTGILCIPILIVGADKTLDIVYKKVQSNKIHEVVIGTEIRPYKLLELSSPKHVYAIFQDEHTVYSQMYVGTYCPGKTTRIGETFNIKVTRYYMSNNRDKEYIKFHDLSRVFCE